eukprot:s1066_g18.t1
MHRGGTCRFSRSTQIVATCQVDGCTEDGDPIQGHIPTSIGESIVLLSVGVRVRIGVVTSHPLLRRLQANSRSAPSCHRKPYFLIIRQLKSLHLLQVVLFAPDMERSLFAIHIANDLDKLHVHRPCRLLLPSAVTSADTLGFEATLASVEEVARLLHRIVALLYFQQPAEDSIACSLRTYQKVWPPLSDCKISTCELPVAGLTKLSVKGGIDGLLPFFSSQAGSCFLFLSRRIYWTPRRSQLETFILCSSNQHSCLHPAF